ncbi:MAG: hypothetical protein Q7K21_07980 [Elusimicrobiota bacterium]|nr:hypothetical protein [Elusimicrobiota bacterium]
MRKKIKEMFCSCLIYQATSLNKLSNYINRRYPLRGIYECLAIFFLLFFGLCIVLPTTVFAASNIKINEVAPSESASTGGDWIEFYVALGGNCSNYILRENTATILGSTWTITNTTTTKTFPNSFNPLTGDYILLHFNVKGSSTSEDDVSGKGANGIWDFYTSDAGLQATDNVLTLRHSSDAVNMIDAVAFADQGGSWTGSNAWFNSAVAEFQWTGGAGEADSADWSSMGAGKSMGRDSLSADTDDTGTAKSDWSIQPSTSPGTVNAGGASGGGGSIKAVITEIDADQSVTADADAVELYVLESTASIGSCVLSISNSGSFSFPSVAVSSGDFIIAHFKAGTNDTVATVNSYGNREWNFYSAVTIVNSDNTLTLKNAAGTIIDFVSYADGSGTYDTAHKTAYIAAGAANQWTPAATTQTTDSEFETESVSNAPPNMTTTKTLNRRTDDFGIPIDTTNAKADWVGGFADRNLGRLVISSGTPTPTGTGSINGKITEVAPGISGNDFIEIFVTAVSSDVSGVKIYDGSSLIKLFPGDIGTVAKDKFIVLWASKANNPTGSRGVDVGGVGARDETAADENGNGWIDLYSDESSPGITNTDGNITLKNANDTIVDFMAFADDSTSYTGDETAYDDAFKAVQWSPEATADATYISGSFAWSGSTSKSMYRLTTAGVLTDTNTKADWLESSTSVGYGDYGVTPINTVKTLEVFQSPFSPYKDGTYNQAKIAYNVPANSQITMRVFDVSGHPVKILIDHIDGGGASATVIWDGKDDNGNIVKTGVYIVNIESLDKTTGSAKTSSKRVVVARKM